MGYLGGLRYSFAMSLDASGQLPTLVDFRPEVGRVS